VQQTRLAEARLADDGHDLTVVLTGAGGGLLERAELGRAADEGHEVRRRRHIVRAQEPKPSC
jgi:hypothetical protein